MGLSPLPYFMSPQTGQPMSCMCTLIWFLRPVSSFSSTMECLPSLLICFAGGKLFSLLGLEKYGWLGFIINCVVAVAIYGICMLAFGMNKSEKNLVFGFFNKLLRKTNLVKDKGE